MIAMCLFTMHFIQESHLQTLHTLSQSLQRKRHFNMPVIAEAARSVYQCNLVIPILTIVLRKPPFQVFIATLLAWTGCAYTLLSL